MEPQAHKTEVKMRAWKSGAKLVRQRTKVEPERWRDAAKPEEWKIKVEAGHCLTKLEPQE